MDRSNKAILVVIVPACACSSEIRVGFGIHSYILKSEVELETALGSVLILTYASCGHMKITEEVSYGVSKTEEH